MAIVFDPSSNRIILDTTAVTSAQIWIAWIDWVATSDNSKYLPAMKQVGGDELGSGLAIPPYIFLLNGWRVRPMEASHTLVLTGNLFVDGGGVPIVPTIGNYNVSAQFTVPVQAQAILVGGSTAPTAEQTADAVWAHSFTSKLLTVAKFLGLK